MLLAAPVTHLPWQGMAPTPDIAPMTVRLAPAPLLVPDVPAAAEPDSRPPAPLQAPDPIYYPARDLDDYPRPLAPLRIGQLVRAGAGEVRLELLIDERGVVRDVVFAGPAESRGAEEELRATLVATSFMPARKDGRPVRSRILLSLNFGAEEREP